MKVLVLGCKGQLGQCLYDQFVKTDYQVVYASRADIDIGDLEDLTRYIKSINPFIVINASAYTDVDKAENEPKTADVINHLAVAKLANACKILNSWFIHISTDYVFDGKATKPYKEDDLPNPQGIYGYSKLNGELAITRSGCNYIIIRTAWVFSEYGNNFLKTMLSLGSVHDELSIVGDQIGCPTYAQDIARVIVSILLSLRSKKSASGIFHYCGDQPCSWYDFAQKIFKTAKNKGYKVPKKLKRITSDEYKTLAIRPLYSVLNSFKVEAEFNMKTSDWAAGIVAAINKI
jgi:dTDP-4-dehydrorhamnose reductase